MCIPRAPHVIDVVAPTQKAKQVYIPETLSTNTKIIPARMTTTIAQIEYSALMNYVAPCIEGYIYFMDLAANFLDG